MLKRRITFQTVQETVYSWVEMVDIEEGSGGESFYVETAPFSNPGPIYGHWEYLLQSDDCPLAFREERVAKGEVQVFEV